VQAVIARSIVLIRAMVSIVVRIRGVSGITIRVGGMLRSIILRI
jgi:hypothetical protein